jgi:hypothetical protein
MASARLTASKEVAWTSSRHKLCKDTDGVSIAYQVFGEGPMDFVVSGYGTHRPLVG